ncbi:MAG: T9SS type A sorting domain-containing protein, partial [Bacteroidales bacterium]|nr:T9SS type A sorting domain-containing protein [Bacteroidales bacterium]
PIISSLSPTTYQITPPIDSSGLYRYDMHIVDDFGCVWDTVTFLNVAQSPIVSLGQDSSSCAPFSLMLDAENPNASSYLWLPTGDTTQTITANTIQDSTITYIAKVTNYNGSIYCFGIDSINLLVNSIPNAPINLAVLAMPTSLELSWLGFAQTYEVYRNDTLLTISNQLTYIDSNLVYGLTYCYKIKALNENCESDFSNLVCKTYTGLDDIITNDLSVILYPNPTKDKTKLEIKGLKTNADVIVSDIYGRVTKTYKIMQTQNELEIDLKGFAKGIYNIKIVNTNSNITKKLIIN